MLKSLTSNIVELDSWLTSCDPHGSSCELQGNGLKIHEDQRSVVALRIRRARYRPEAEPWVTLVFQKNLDKSRSYFTLNALRGLKIRYRTEGEFPLRLYFQHRGEDDPGKLPFLQLEASADWRQVMFSLKDIQFPLGDNLKALKKREMSGLCFQFEMNEEAGRAGLYLSEVTLKGYRWFKRDLKKGRIQYNRSYTSFWGILGHWIKRAVAPQFSLKKNPGEHPLMDPQGEKLYCMYPFYNLRLDPDKATPCCWIEGDFTEESSQRFELDELWKGEKFQAIRKSLGNGGFDYCSIGDCSKSKVFSKFFLTLNEIQEVNPQAHAYLTGEVPHYEGFPQRLELAFDSQCNLRCPSCDHQSLPRFSSAVKQRYFDQITEISKEVEVLYLSGMGDPFGTQSYRSWLLDFPEEAFPKLKKLIFQTNGAMLNEEFWNRFPLFLKKREIELRLSLDGGIASTIEKNRLGIRFDVLRENMKHWADWRAQGDINFMAIDCVVQQNNFSELMDLLETARNFLFDEISLSRITNWGTYSEEEFSEIDVLNPRHSQYASAKDQIEGLLSKALPIKVDVACL